MIDGDVDNRDDHYSWCSTCIETYTSSTVLPKKGGDPDNDDELWYDDDHDPHNDDDENHQPIIYHYHSDLLTRQKHVAEYSHRPHITLGIVRSVQHFRSSVITWADFLRQLLTYGIIMAVIDSDDDVIMRMLMLIMMMVIMMMTK